MGTYFSLIVCVSQSLCALSGSLSVWLSVCLAVCLSIKSNQPTSSNQRITQTNVLQASWCNAFADCCLCLASLLHVLLFSVLLWEQWVAFSAHVFSLPSVRPRFFHGCAPSHIHSRNNKTHHTRTALTTHHSHVNHDPASKACNCKPKSHELPECQLVTDTHPQTNQ